MKKTTLTKLENAINALAIEFVEKYYLDYVDDWYWVGDEIGGVLIVSDVFVNVNDMMNAAKYKPTLNQWHAWYWSYEDEKDYYRKLNLKHFILKNPKL